ncbi:glycosyltransferase [Natrononativus amylolyticus]|uniref:glycosyltransferase n=1 Tax=Natrononativus amylolyticus TaxID=2963434 RepID=UPI0020CF48BD|nr:glycosyltransferase family A protein [Natrononativus amylolyticus]
MAESPPTSVILPTVEPGGVCEEVAAQLGEDDELLVVCDAETDPVAERADTLPDGARVVVAGEPDGCSGKANAVAAGMEAAESERIVWTDDDFHHPPDWLEGLHADYAVHGPTTELPVFVGTDPLSLLLEPLYVVGGTLSVYVNDLAWAGSVIFERDDLDEAGFLDELRRTVSDDGLLGEHLEVTPVKRPRRVEIGGTIRGTLERHARFTKIAHRHGPKANAASGVGAAAVTAAGLAVPLPAIAVLTALLGALYASFGIRRWTFLLAYPAVLASVPLMAYGLARRTFVWGGRRYRWPSKFDVRIEDE